MSGSCLGSLNVRIGIYNFISVLPNREDNPNWDQYIYISTHSNHWHNSHENQYKINYGPIKTMPTWICNSLGRHQSNFRDQAQLRCYHNYHLLTKATLHTIAISVVHTLLDKNYIIGKELNWNIFIDISGIYIFLSAKLTSLPKLPNLSGPSHCQRTTHAETSSCLFCLCSLS